VLRKDLIERTEDRDSAPDPLHGVNRETRKDGVVVTTITRQSGRQSTIINYPDGRVEELPFVTTRASGIGEIRSEEVRGFPKTSVET